MKISKSLMVIVLLLVSFTAFSQQNIKLEQNIEERAKRQLKAIDKECNLNDDQRIKVEKILLNSKIKLTTLIADKSIQKVEKLKELKSINDNQTAEIEKVLSPEQIIKYQVLVERQKEKVRNRIIEKRGEVQNVTE